MLNCGRSNLDFGYDDFGSQSRSMFYAQSWLLVHYLLTGHLHSDRIEEHRLPELVRYSSS